MKKVDLNALQSIRNAVELDGQLYDVRAITHRIACIIDAAVEATDGVAKLTGFHDAVALIVPTMPRALIEDLEVAQIAAIIDLSKTALGIVEEAALDPNVQSSAPTTATEQTLAVST